ncbi:hypothetical protein ACFFJB_03775 [Camelimonas abortus]|uniref:Uncharacterized protein n=1 Tax=Camelimonas abortus TaxID=1017184 RepID=A0ABV7LDB0_9HYPH
MPAPSTTVLAAGVAFTAVAAAPALAGVPDAVSGACKIWAYHECRWERPQVERDYCYVRSYAACLRALMRDRRRRGAPPG